MSLKKVILVFITIVLITLLVLNTHYTFDNKMKIQSAVTVSELPPPPGVPSFEQPAQTTTTTGDTDVLVEKLSEMAELKQRVTTIENEQSSVKQRLTSTEQKTMQLDTQVQSLQQGMAGQTIETGSSAFGVIIDILLLLAIAGIIGYMVYTKMKEEKEKIEAIKDYLRPYMQQGYTQAQLTPSLKQAGYKQSEIDKALKELEGPII